MGMNIPTLPIYDATTAQKANGKPMNEEREMFQVESTVYNSNAATPEYSDKNCGKSGIF